jgi:hypothetical protein
MKLQKVDTQNSPSYPILHIAKTVLIGTSITAAIVLIGCQNKEKSESSNTPNTPNTSNTPKPSGAKPHHDTLKKKTPFVKMPNDTDQDGINDISDKCPNIKGSAANNRCPSQKVPTQQMLGNIRTVQPTGALLQARLSEPQDSDGDGVPDDKDQCPNKKGQKYRAGCPKPKPKLMGLVIQVIEPIESDLTIPHIITKQSPPPTIVYQKKQKKGN